MGDTGSLALGGIIAVLALARAQRMMIPLLCGIFLIETSSVIIQVLYFGTPGENMEKGEGYS